MSGSGYHVSIPLIFHDNDILNLHQ